MQIKESKQGAVTVLEPHGPLIEGDASEFASLAVDASRRSLGRIVLDATSMPYADSAGVEALLDTADAGGEAGVLRVTGVSETLREILTLTGVARHFEHFPDVRAAVRSFL